MQQYLELLKVAKEHGIFKGDRTNTGTQSRFGQHARFSLHKDYNAVLPKVTTKYITQPSIDHELKWVMGGDTRLEYLIANKVRIWNEWVIPGTEVWQDLTVEEIKSRLRAHVVEHIGKEHCKHDGEFTVEYTGSATSVEELDHLAYDATLLVNSSEYAKHQLATTVELIAKGDTDKITLNHLQTLHRVVLGSEPRKLVGGELGPVYGKTWRNIEDVRIVPKYQWPDYEKRGFTFVIDLPGESYLTDRCVVERKVDQLAEVLDSLSREPTEGDGGNNRDSRRLIICAWDPRLIEDQALPPCHAFIQFWTRKLTLTERVKLLAIKESKEEAQLAAEGIIQRGKPPITDVEMMRKYIQMWKKDPVTDQILMDRLDAIHIPTRAISCSLYQRSADLFLGVPFNITFYSLLTHMLANQFNMLAEEFIWTGGDTHIYSNHQEQTDLQLTRECYNVPEIAFRKEAVGKSILEITPEDYAITNYEYHPHIAGKVAV